jgi:hypothetical protein
MKKGFCSSVARSASCHYLAAQSSQPFENLKKEIDEGVPALRYSRIVALEKQVLRLCIIIAAYVAFSFEDLQNCFAVSW